MRTKTLVWALALAALCFATGASARGNGNEYYTDDPCGVLGSEPSGEQLRGARLETLWIFWANFNDPDDPDNQGWTTYDRSGTLAQDNYWHHDTIRLTETYLGESTWWCGKYDICWRQPRGYGNDWVQLLSRTLTAGEMGSPGDVVELEWDQRFAMERLYDYGYVEIKGPADPEWVNIGVYNNGGFQGAGLPRDWTWPATGHPVVDLSDHAGQEIELRFRFESDIAYSSQDQYDNQQHSVKDGAWQLDNIQVSVNGTPTFYDDCESGNMGWVHDPRQAAGQTGVVFWRGEFDVDFETGRPFTCEDRVGWMHAAVDPFTSTMVDDQSSWLMSPPIDQSGAPKLVGHWDYWLDMPYDSGDRWDLYLAANDIYDCVTDEAGFVDESPGGWYGDAGWRTRFDDWDAFTGNDWLAILCKVWNDFNPEPGAQHWAGAIFNRWAVGIPSGDAGTTWDRDTWNQYNDWFIDDWADAQLDTARIQIKDDDDIAEAHVMASNDNGQTWEAYPMHKESPESNWWLAPPPLNQMGGGTTGSEVHYYFEAIDGVGNVATLPSGAPGRYYEFSVLPLTASVSNPGILLVDKHGRNTPGESRYFGVYHSSEYYYREMLGILGYDWETYDVDVPSGTVQSFGPDTAGMKYYDTQIFFFNEFNAFTLWPIDQWNLIQWLSQAAEGKERNLLLTGNDHGFEMVEAEKETLNFYTTWLASEYVSNDVGVVTVDSVPGLTDEPGNWPFLEYTPDAARANRCQPEGRDVYECVLAGGCPVLMYFDVVDARPGLPGNEVVANYCKQDATQLPAGVAYTHPTIGYQTVNLGFGMEFMQSGDCTDFAEYTPEGYFVTGLPNRCFLMGQIMEYFEKLPTNPGTDVPEGSFRNMLSEAYPNPFNPVTRIAYSVKESGHVSVNVYNVAGRLVRTLLDEELEAGASGELTWNGADDHGKPCASGVYFYRIEAPGFSAIRKMVILK